MYKVEKKEYKFNCKNCDTEYIEVLSENSFKKSKYKKHCSQKCANSRIQTEAINEKRSKTILDKKLCERENRKCKECGKKFETRIKRNKLFCNRSCSSRYNNRIRNIGRRNNLTEYQLYREKCKFKFNIYDYPDYFNLDLIDKYGWYNASNRGNNLNGISRDHKISILYGWENNIKPSVIAHPANCQLLRHNKNQRKNRYCSITIDELKKEINKWVSARVD